MGLQHFPLTLKVHMEWVGVHCPNKIATQPIKLIRQMIAMAHIMMACTRLGLSMRVNKATTASLGTANDRIPGKKATMVYRMA